MATVNRKQCSMRSSVENTALGLEYGLSFCLCHGQLLCILVQVIEGMLFSFSPFPKVHEFS